MKEAAAALHRRAVVVDAHCDTVLDLAAGRRRLGVRSAQGHVDLPRLREGGVDVQFFAHFVEPRCRREQALKRFLELYDAFMAEAEANARDLAVVSTWTQLEEALAQGRIAAVIAIEGGDLLCGSLEVLRCLRRLGVGVLGLTWNERNDLADGVGEAARAGGLTRFGRQVVAEMNRLGMVIDVSHLAEPGFWDVLDLTSQPVIASHSNARAVCDHVRNLTDDQIRALAANGGVMGLNFCPPFVDPHRADVDRLVDHALHVLELVGPDHLGLGSDFDGILETPAGLEDAGRFPRLTEALLKRGVDENTVAKILGGNFLRVLRQVWGSAPEPSMT
ncbi:MAG: peptidase [Bacillota bacterium]|nr:peptidase [Bacillota bacterium]REJ34038.1 MAG: peptidase [Bacillota bacterium]